MEDDEFPTRQRLLLVFDQGQGRFGLQTRMPLVRRLYEFLERPELREQLRGALCADAGNAGDIVGTISHDRQVVDDLIGPHAEFLENGVGVKELLPGFVPHLNIAVNELQRVLISGDENDAHSFANSAARERGEQIVGLEPGSGDRRKTERLGQFLGDLQLRDQIRVDLDARRLIVLEFLVPEGFLGSVEADRDVIGSLGLAQRLKHPREAEKRPDRFPVFRCQRRKRVIRPMQIGVGVYEIKGFSGIFRHGATKRGERIRPRS